MKSTGALRPSKEGATRPSLVTDDDRGGEEVQVVARQRVTDHGEVYTGAREVEAMVGLVSKEADRIESRFLEPACGNGNFLSAVLARKLTVENLHHESQWDFKLHSIVATASIYGIDILQDNVKECSTRLLKLFNDSFYARLYGDRRRAQCLNVIRYILKKNIICGDTLLMSTLTPKSTADCGNRMVQNQRRSYSSQRVLFSRQ